MGSALRPARPAILLWAFIMPAFAGEVTLTPIPGQAELGTVEIHNVGAGRFDPAIWQAGTLNLVPDVRRPLIAPRLDGVFRNIYAPSAVEVGGGWRLFYGAWDGVPSGNDRIYSVTTDDFLTFRDWRITIEHGEFIHVCNVNAIRDPSGAIRMVCTAYPVGDKLNKPVTFTVPAATTEPADRSPFAPIRASRNDLVSIGGYAPFDAADMNGMNVLLFEEGHYRLYFGDFKNRGHVHRASSTDGRHFRYDGPCLTVPRMVNDIRRFSIDGRQWYLMALHANTDRLWYALSTDGMKFDPPRELAVNLGPADRYIVAIGWVTRADRVLGFLYGAGAVRELNRNRIFARWLQKKLVLVDSSGRQHTPTAALAPDRAVLSLGDARELAGTLQVLADDGRTSLGQPFPVKLTSGAVYRLDAP
ncbi:MAG: hypothetical protein HY718_06355 [Planctomycetes bacterium]|nr:hypothetical protein [Planctomycetota bacterium]